MRLVQKTNNWATLAPLSEDDLGQRAMDWCDELEPEIPLERLPDVIKRARKNHKGVYAINLYEFTDAWEQIKREDSVIEREKAEREKVASPVLSCKFKSEHVNDRGEVSIVNFFDTSREIIVPCKECRKKAYDAWRERFIAQNSDKSPATDPVKIIRKRWESLDTSKVLRDHPLLSPEESAGLVQTLNGYVHKLTGEEFWTTGEIIYDRKMKLFRHSHRTDLTYTAEDVARLIEDYREIWEKEE